MKTEEEVTKEAIEYSAKQFEALVQALQGALSLRDPWNQVTCLRDIEEVFGERMETHCRLLEKLHDIKREESVEEKIAEMLYGGETCQPSKN